MQVQPLDYAQPVYRSLWARAWPLTKWVLIVSGLVSIAAIVALIFYVVLVLGAGDGH